jgi:hypothetical protein
MAIRRLEDEKSALQKRVKELEQDDHPTAELRRLRDENATLRAILATTAKEKAEITRERDVLLRKLNGVKQLILDPTVRPACATRIILNDINKKLPPHSSTTKPPATHTPPNPVHQPLHPRAQCATHVNHALRLRNAPSPRPRVRPDARISQSP